ncbi:MAG: CPBP family intramembrane metalloprotease, partial [Clostridiales bacterium]|nr:CPBP family intramembrane metalloprotease [Clostridiales bacterium]
DIEAISQNTNVYLTIMVLELIILGIPAVFFCILRGGGYSKELRIRMMQTRHITITVWAFLFMTSGSIVLSFIMYYFFPDAFVASAMAGGLTTETSRLYLLITFALLPALLEEFIFRGILSAEYSSYGASVAVIMSSLCFGLLHFSFVRLPIYFFMGVILSLTAGATRSLMPSILIHAANNAFVLFFETYLYRIAGKHSGGLILLAFLIGVATLVFAILFFSRAEKLYYGYGVMNRPSPLLRKRKPGELSLPAQAFLSPTFILFVVFSVILTVFL